MSQHIKTRNTEKKTSMDKHNDCTCEGCQEGKNQEYARRNVTDVFPSQSRSWGSVPSSSSTFEEYRVDRTNDHRFNPYAASEAIEDNLPMQEELSQLFNELAEYEDRIEANAKKLRDSNIAIALLSVLLLGVLMFILIR